MVPKKWTANNMIYLSITISYLAVLSDSANILVALPFAARSHHILLRPIGLELARRGHNVTVISPFKELSNLSTYHHVQSDGIIVWEAMGVDQPNIFTITDMSDEAFHDGILWKGVLATTDVALKSVPFQEFMKKDNKFDLVICQLFFQEAIYALAHKYNAPLVLLTTYGSCMRHNILARNPLQQATVTPEFAVIREPMSFAGRLRTFYFAAYEYFWWRFWYLEQQEGLVKKYIPGLPQPMPSLLEIQKNASLVLMNRHFSFDSPMALLPNLIDIGGVHLAYSNMELPEDLKNILDNSKHGVIYMNFGSNVKSSELPTEKRDAVLNVFRKLKQTVLWKWEDDTLDNKPDNVITRKWMPQKEILAHPNVKVFVAHGGLIGMQEAIYHGVPVIGVPIYADQYNNLLQAQEIGFGKILNYHDINEQNLEKVLRQVLGDSSYKAKAEYISNIFQDRPTSAMDTAMFWIEYVIRHKGAEFMKNPATKLSWVEYNMLDVYGFVLAVLFTCVLVIVKLLIVLKNLFISKLRCVTLKKKLM